MSKAYEYNNKMKIEVYADGSGNTFDSDGGYGWRMVVDGVVNSEGSGYIPKATNNVAELTAAIKGLEAALAFVQTQTTVSITIELISDSQLVLGYASGAYRCKAVHLVPLYIQLRKTYGLANASQRWVKGHSGDPHNEACDLLAKNARLSKGIANPAK